MGNKQPNTLTVNFQKIAHKYMDLITYVNIRECLYEDSMILRSTIVDYCTSRYKFANNILKADDKITDVTWIWCVHKLHPNRFKNDLYLLYPSDNTIEWFVKACTEQKTFCHEAAAAMHKFNLKKWIKSYLKFLQMCRENPTIRISPSVEQNFMWHVHLQDHLAYDMDTTNMFGKILYYESEELRKLTSDKN